MKFQAVEPSKKQENLKVIGLGGAGSNAVNHMAQKQTSDVTYICANTDMKHLDTLVVDEKLVLGLEGTTKGLGAGMKSTVGQEATRESEEDIRLLLSGADLVFIVAGMGGGTGTGAAPVVAEIAKEMGILCVAIVNKPFSNEGRRKRRMAQEGIDLLTRHVDSLIILPNDRLADTLHKDILLDMDKTYESANAVMANAVNAVVDIITKTGRMNIDFADVTTVMSFSGKAMISAGTAKGENRAIQAIESALSNPLVEEMNLSDAKGVLINISAAKVGHNEFGDIGCMMEDYAHEDALIKIGYMNDPSLGDNLHVTVILTGLSTIPKDGEEEVSAQKKQYRDFQHTTPSIIDPSIEVEIIKPSSVSSQVATQIHINQERPINSDIVRMPSYLTGKQYS